MVTQQDIPDSDRFPPGSAEIAPAPSRSPGKGTAPSWLGRVTPSLRDSHGYEEKAGYHFPDENEDHGYEQKTGGRLRRADSNGAVYHEGQDRRSHKPDGHSLPKEEGGNPPGDLPSGEDSESWNRPRCPQRNKAQRCSKRDAHGQKPGHPS